MKREREIRRLFEQAGHQKHYEILRNEKRQRTSLKLAIEQLSAGGQLERL